MRFYADLHIHSKFSRATSKNCNLEQLAWWAARKGITVVGAGDFTHPAWRDEIKRKLVPAEPGLFRLREKSLPGADETRFMLQVEISTIYKKWERTRKVHHIIYVPDAETADRLAERLSRIGNIASDGRPILGLDSRHLLEITLESGEGACLIPAHIWTPWFSALGSQSGFDSIEDCYGDLASHIFAAETGLSSDPPMNWRLSSLDRYRLVSNSDAHSPDKLGREACVFDTAPDYFAMISALKTGQGYGGTVEFFPEEGKYHLDGHRKCGVRFTPDQTRENGGLCPVCGKAVTVGVMHRVEKLADRAAGARPGGAAPFRNLIPLSEALSEILGVGPDSKNVRREYEALLAKLGPELFILEQAPIEDIRRACSGLFTEAIARMRAGRVIRDAGYDGEYGVIRLFEKHEMRRDNARSFLFDIPPDTERTPLFFSAPAIRRQRKKPADRAREVVMPAYGTESSGILDCLDPEQRAAAEITDAPLLIIAGPGAGKTRTLTHRIAHLADKHGIPPGQCLAITFTRRAAGEMLERLRLLMPDKADEIPIMTFHAFGCAMLREHGERLGLPRRFRVVGESEKTRTLMKILPAPERKAQLVSRKISELKRGEEMPDPNNDISRAFDAYCRETRNLGAIDFDDLIGLPLELLDACPELAGIYRERYPYVSIDEYQDIDERQYRLIKLLVPPDGHICAIGDPDQAIYGFRGSDARFFQRFKEDFPGARVIQLTRNYRSGKMIVEASQQVITPFSLVMGRVSKGCNDDTTRLIIHESVTDRAEAEFVAHSIERLIGGSSFFSMDSGRVDGEDGDDLSFSDFAVLYRADAQTECLVEALARSGMPFQKRSHTCLADTPPARSLIAALPGTAANCGVAERLDRAIECLPDDLLRSEQALSVIRALRLTAERHTSMEEFLSELAMGTDVDLWDSRADCISLLTLHASKGLEFPVVFIVGCEDGILPLRWGEDDGADLAEERRLFFVGMTRARRRLFLCHAGKRLWRGAVREMAPSPFLQSIREELFEKSRTRAGGKGRHTPEQLDLFNSSEKSS